jgi:hypothetical protein
VIAANDFRSVVVAVVASALYQRRAAPSAVFAAVPLSAEERTTIQEYQGELSLAVEYSVEEEAVAAGKAG